MTYGKDYIRFTDIGTVREKCVHLITPAVMCKRKIDDLVVTQAKAMLKDWVLKYPVERGFLTRGQTLYNPKRKVWMFRAVHGVDVQCSEFSRSLVELVRAFETITLLRTE